MQANRQPDLNLNTLSYFCPEILPLGNQDENILNRELPLFQAIHNISLMLSNEQCDISFFCKAVLSSYGDGADHEDLEEECVHIRDNNCTTEWRVLENIFNVSIPGCVSTKAKPPDCPDQFNVFCDSFCLPSCPDFSQYSEVANVTNYAVMVTFELIGLISGVITLVACLFNRKKM